MWSHINRIQEEMERSTVIVGNFNTSFLTMGKTSRQKIIKKQMIIKLLSENLWASLCDLGFDNGLRYITLKRIHTQKDKFDIIKIKYLHIRGHYQENETATYKMGKIFSNHISDNDLGCRIYIKNSYNSMTKRKTQFKYEQNIWINIIPRKIYNRLANTWKYAQHHYSLGICNQNKISHHSTPT